MSSSHQKLNVADNDDMQKAHATLKGFLTTTHENFQQQYKEFHQQLSELPKPVFDYIVEKSKEALSDMQVLEDVIKKQVSVAQKQLGQFELEYATGVAEMQSSRDDKTLFMEHLKNPLLAAIKKYNEHLAKIANLLDKSKAIVSTTGLFQMTKDGVGRDEIEAIGKANNRDELLEKINKILSDLPAAHEFVKLLKLELTSEFKKVPENIFDFKKQLVQLNQTEIGKHLENRTLESIKNAAEEMAYKMNQGVNLNPIQQAFSSWQRERDRIVENMKTAQENFTKAESVRKQVKDYLVDSKFDIGEKNRQAIQVADGCASIIMFFPEKKGSVIDETEKTLKSVINDINRISNEIDEKLRRIESLNNSLSMHRVDHDVETIKRLKSQVEASRRVLSGLRGDLDPLLPRLQGQEAALFEAQHGVYDIIKNILLHNTDFWKTKKTKTSFFIGEKQVPVHQGIGEMMKYATSPALDNTPETASERLKMLVKIASEALKDKDLDKSDVSSTKDFFMIISTLQHVRNLSDMDALNNIKGMVAHFYASNAPVTSSKRSSSSSSSNS